jgi:small GTP-binding protein
MAKKKQKVQRLPPGVKLVRSFKSEVPYCLTFDPKGRILATGGPTVTLWEVSTGKLLRTLKGHRMTVTSLAFDPLGEKLASGSSDKIIKLWETRSGTLLRTFEGHKDIVRSLAFDPLSNTLASASDDGKVKLWEVDSGKLLSTLDGDGGLLFTLAFKPQSEMLAVGGSGGSVQFWEASSGKLLRTLEGHPRIITSLAFDPSGDTLATGSLDYTVRLWDTRSGKLLCNLEGHTSHIDIVSFSPNGRAIASKSGDHTIRLWSCETWEVLAVNPTQTIDNSLFPALSLNPKLPFLATASSQSVSSNKRMHQICLWELDWDVLLGKHTDELALPSVVHHTTGKIVLVGDHSVGKSALGHRLIHSEFKEQASTHGQKFWVFPALGKRREDGTECEAILWDFAGQPDYRLVHALFVDNADLALVLFDASDINDPLHGVGFWHKQLQTGQSRCPIMLVAAQVDRGTSPLTDEELKAFCQTHGIVGPIATSALTGVGIDELIDRMKSLILWEDKAATVTTATFKRVKDYVLNLKETQSQRQTIVTPEELRERLEATDREWQFTDDEMLTAVGHLENYGYVKRLRTSKGELRLLLEPERLNNLASTFVLEARRNPKGLGALEEKRLLEGGYDFPELRGLADTDRDVLLDSAALLFLEHNVCFRETDPLRVEPYLVFPELINLKKIPDNVVVTEDGAAYTVSGPTENVFASLVVLLGYTHTFTRTAQWQNNARYEVGDRLVCGFRQEAERDGELDFVLSFAANVGQPVRTLFQGLFESFLARRNLTVQRYEPVRCGKNHLLNRTVVREAMRHGDETTFCSKCGEKLTLPPIAEPIQLTREVQGEVETQRRAAEQRTRYEQAVFRLRAYITEQTITPPQCFISYAWGVPEHERWVEKRLATDLQKAGINVVLDRWHNAQIGASVARFVERIEDCARIIAVGTPLYREKAKNAASAKGSVVAAEYDLAGIRLLATEDQKRTVLPVLLVGDEAESFPALLRGRVYADFRNDESYFRTAFDLILSVYELPPNHPAVADLRESLLPQGIAFRT